MRRLSVLVPLLAVLLVGTALPAQAESWTGRDPDADVQRLARSGDGGDYTPAPTRANPDIRGATVSHGRRAVVVSVTFDDIFVPPGRSGVFAVFGETRSDVPGASWDMWATQGRRQGKVTIWRRGEKCRGSSRVDYVRDRAPRRAPAQVPRRPPVGQPHRPGLEPGPPPRLGGQGVPVRLPARPLDPAPARGLSRL